MRSVWLKHCCRSSGSLKEQCPCCELVGQGVAVSRQVWCVCTINHTDLANKTMVGIHTLPNQFLLWSSLQLKAISCS